LAVPHPLPLSWPRCWLVAVTTAAWGHGPAGGREHQHWQRDGGVRHGVLLLQCEAAAACVRGAAGQDGEEIGEGLRPAGARLVVAAIDG